MSAYFWVRRPGGEWQFARRYENPARETADPPYEAGPAKTRWEIFTTPAINIEHAQFRDDGYEARPIPIPES